MLYRIQFCNHDTAFHFQTRFNQIRREYVRDLNRLCERIADIMQARIVGRNDCIDIHIGSFFECGGSSPVLWAVCWHRTGNTQYLWILCKSISWWQESLRALVGGWCDDWRVVFPIWLTIWTLTVRWHRKLWIVWPIWYHLWWMGIHCRIYAPATWSSSFVNTWFGCHRRAASGNGI